MPVMNPGMTDAEILVELGRRLRRERLDRDLTIDEVARRADLSDRTVRNVEAGRSSSSSTLLALLRVYGLLSRLDVLLPEAVPSPIQMADRDGETRKRASKRPSQESDW